MTDLNDNYTIQDLPSLSFIPTYRSKVKSWHEHKPFGCDIMHLSQPKLFVELGTHYGDSYFTFCQTNKEYSIGAKCYAVDNWKGDSQSGYYEKEVFQEVSDYNQSQYRDFSELIKSDFDNALQSFEDKSIDLLHIDGHHTYESVKNDFENWFPKMSENGIVIIHDTMVRSRDFGVWRFWAEIEGDFLSCSFSHGHGLGIIMKGNDTTSNKICDFIQSLIKCKYYEVLGSKLYFQYKCEKIESTLININLDMQRLNKQLDDAELKILEKSNETRISKIESHNLSKELKELKEFKIIKLIIKLSRLSDS